jgi:hypothetical protein
MPPAGPLNFTPAPTSGRHDGWSAADQREFIRRLARGHSVDEAAKALGHSRQSVYVLRRKPGAEDFARAWVAAQSLGRAVWEARRCSPGCDLEYGLETVLAPRFYRGRFVGFVQRQDHRAALGILAELDREIDEGRKLSKLTR